MAENDDYFLQELGCHFPALLPEVLAARSAAEARLPRPLSDELHADRHHRAAIIYENVTRFGGADAAGRWPRVLLELWRGVLQQVEAAAAAQRGYAQRSSLPA